MRQIQVKEKINEILANNPDFIDQIPTKELKEKLESEYQFNVSIGMLNNVLTEIVDSSSNPDGYQIPDGRYFTYGDEHGNGDSKLRGLHKYWWFLH